VERHAYNLARYLSKSSHDVHVVTAPSQNPVLDFQLDCNLEGLYKIKVFRRLPKTTYLPFYGSAKYVLNCHKVVRYINEWGNNYDIVHYHGAHQLLFRFAKTKVPIFTTVHGIFPACVLQLPNPCRKQSVASCAICDINQKPEHIIMLPIMMPYYFSYYRFMKESLNRINQVICVSEYLRRYIKRSLNLNNAITIHNFIDLEEVRSGLTYLTRFDIRNNLNMASNARIISYFGRLSYEKGVDLLILSFQMLRKVYDDIYLLIGGEGPQKARLEKMAKSIKNVIFMGALPRNVQLAVMAQSDIFVHPARYPDACPTVIIEAMALGLPVIATKLGGIPELVVDGKGGFLVNSNSPKDLATKISTILSNEKFKFQAKAFNLKWAHRFDIKYLGPKIIELYERALV